MLGRKSLSNAEIRIVPGCKQRAPRAQLRQPNSQTCRLSRHTNMPALSVKSTCKRRAAPWYRTEIAPCVCLANTRAGPNISNSDFGSENLTVKNHAY
jgi:hypothetical protein